jgi:dienelactone hydrolase
MDNNMRTRGKFTWWGLAFYMFSMASVLVHAAATRPPAQAFGAIPHMSGVVLSPNGTMLAWIQNDVTSSQVVMYNLTTQKARQLGAGSVKPRRLIWVDNETLLMEVSITIDTRDDAKRRYEFYRYVAADVSGGPLRVLLKSDPTFELVTGAELMSIRPAKPKSVYLVTWSFSGAAQQEEIGTRLTGHRKDSGWLSTVYEVDTVSGKGRMIERGTPFTADWVVDRSGRVLARGEWHADRGEYRLLAADGGGWRELLAQNDGEQVGLIGPTTDTKAIVALGKLGQNRSRAWNIPLDGSKPTVLAEDPEHDITSIRYDAVTMTPLSIWLSGTDAPLKWLDKNMESRYLSVAKAFPDRQVDAYQESQDHGRALALVQGPSHPPVNYIVDFVTHKAIIVGEEYPALVGAALGEVSRITYAARDGTSIPAFQTLPPGSSGRNLPLVVLPHGGPNYHDPYAFDWLAQFLATRGYAVLQPQFRGSTGYGEAFERAGDRQWGRLMQDDITDGVKALIDKGIADVHRICIVGASYGGYAALAGAAFTPDLYACAASIGGVSDLPAMLAYLDSQHGNESDTVGYWKTNIGSAHDPEVIAKSPARAAEAVRAPILLIHGVDDTVVPISQSEIMAQALKVAGKPPVFVKLTKEDHWLSRTETRVRVLEELESFLATYLRVQ